MIENRVEWLKAAWDNFEEALARGDEGMCKAVIADVQEAGFLEDGRSMNQRMRDVPGRGMEFHSMISFLKEKKEHYQKNNLIPTIDLLIEDLEGEWDGLLKK